MATTRARRSTSARRGPCAIACAATSGPTAPIPRPTRCSTRSTALEVIVTDSVVEALALENNLIKRRSPRYNILLRDDKNYPYLQLTLTEAFPRVLVARQVERDGDLYAGPFLPATLARRTMSLTPQAVRPALLQRGHHRPPAAAVPRVRHQAVPGAVRRRSVLARALRAGRGRRPLPARRPQRRAGRRARAAHAGGRRRRAVRGGRAPRDAMRVVQALSERQQKMATAELGDRDVFGVKVGERGAVDPGVPGPPRTGRRAGDAVQRRPRGGRRGRGRRRRRAAAVLRGAGAAPRGLRAGRHRRRRRDGGVALGPRRRARCASSCRSAATSARLVELATRNAELCVSRALRTRRAGRVRRRSSSSSRPCSCRPCRGASSASTSPRSRAARRSPRSSSAKTAGWRRGEYRKFRVRDRGSGTGTVTAADTAVRESIRAESDVLRAPVPEPRSPFSRRLRRHGAGRPPPLRRGARSRRAVPRPDRHRRRQGPARPPRTRRWSASGCPTWWRSAWPRRRSWSSPATATRRWRSSRTARRSVCCSASATRRTASP